MKKFLNFMNLTVSAQEFDQYRVAYIIATISMHQNFTIRLENDRVRDDMVAVLEVNHIIALEIAYYCY